MRVDDGVTTGGARERHRFCTGFGDFFFLSFFLFLSPLPPFTFVSDVNTLRTSHGTDTADDCSAQHPSKPIRTFFFFFFFFTCILQ